MPPARTHPSTPDKTPPRTAAATQAPQAVNTDQHRTSTSYLLDGRNTSPPPASAEPSSTRAAKSDSTRLRIILAAAAAFDRRGYNGVNLNDVVVSLGLTKGALYYFFPTKEDLAVEIVRRHFAAWAPLAEEVFAAHDNKIDALVEVTYRVAKQYQSDPIARAGTRLSTERNLIDADLPEPFVGWIERLTSLLRSAKARRQLRPGVRPADVASVVVAHFYGAQVISHQSSPDRADLIQRLDRFWNLLLPTLRPD
jgi:AcrR family transcriptional regulator